MIWTTEKADAEFSKFIRARDPFCYFLCGRRSTDCSHYWGRGNSATRYDPSNCDGACRECHTLYGEETGGYYERLKRQQLGPVYYAELERRARSVKKRESARFECMVLLGKA